MNHLPLMRPPEGAKKWVAFSCPHAPLQDKDALAVVAERIREFAPDYVICLGDLHEMDSASRWPSEYDWKIEDEYWEANENVLKPLRLANRNKEAEYLLLPGNHDDNLFETGRVNPKLRNLLDWTLPQYARRAGKTVQVNSEFLTHWRTPCEYSYNRKAGTFRIGATVFAHGYEAGAASDVAQSITLGWPYGLFVSGHTHRPTPGEPRQAMKTAALPLDRWYLNAGCTRSMECGYMKRKRQQMWGHAVCYGWSMPINSPRFSRSWDAYCELISPYEEAA